MCLKVQKAMFAVASLLLFVIGVRPAKAQSWPNGYTYVRTITISHAKVPNTDQTYFPVLISGTYSYLATTSNGGYVTNANGYDIIFTSDSAGSNILHFEQDYYSPSTGAIDYWVEVPTLSHTADTVIYMYYGNSSITTIQSGYPWNSNYDGVWHMGDGSSLYLLKDSTGNNGWPQYENATATTGEISGAGYFNGSNQYIDLANGPSLQPSGAMTASAWINASSSQLQYPMIVTMGGSNGQTGYNLYLDNCGYASFILDVGGWGNCWVVGPAVNDNTWHYLVGTYSGAGGSIEIYVDGVLKASSTCPNDPTVYGSSVDAQIGWKYGSLSNDDFNGSIDEVRISSTALSSDSISTEYNNQGSPSTFYTMGSASQAVPPSFTSSNSTTFTVGSSGSFTVTATGAPTPSLSKSGSFPDGVEFNAGTGVFSGIPVLGSGGTYSVTFTASNGVSPNANQSFTLTVNQSSAITSANNASFTMGDAGSFTVAASGSPTPTLSESGTLPSGVSFNTSTGVLSGTPASGTTGNYSVTFTASNGVGSNATQNFTLSVYSQTAPAITSATGATFTIDSLGAFTVTATGDPTPSISESGSLPSGVSFNTGTNVLEGTPDPGTNGTYSVTFTASNGVGSNATQNFTLTVGTISATVFYYFEDHLGSSRVITNSSGAVCYDADFYPYGGERAYTSTCDPAYKFTGKERDSESGLDNFGARFYSSQYGRFMTPDWSASPVAVAYADLTDPQTLNLYGYVRNNPLSKVDPNGHCDWCQKLKNWWNYQVWVTNANLNAALATRAAQALQAMHDQGVSIRGQASDAALKGKSNQEIVDTYNRFLSDQNNNRVLAIGTMLGANGAQFTSKTLWESGEGHIDVENPNPGQRPGQIHYQDASGKYIFNVETGEFEGLSQTQSRNLLGQPGVQDAIQKGLRFLGAIK